MQSNQALIDAFNDIETPVRLFEYMFEVYHGLVEDHRDEFMPVNTLVYEEMTGRLTTALEPNAYLLCAFAVLVADLHPELVGRPPKATGQD